MPRFLSACGLILALVLLAGASRAVWQYRFRSVEGAVPLVLGHQPEEVQTILTGDVHLPERGGELSMTAAAQAPRVQYRWTAMPASQYAYISLEAGCEDVVIGRYPWDDARVLVIWLDQAGKQLKDFLPVWSARGTRAVRFREMILPLSRQGGLPCLMIENLGSQGHLTLKSLTVQAVEQRKWVPWATAGLIAGWVAVLTLLVRCWITKQAAWWRMTLTAATCVAFIWYGAFPGPWMPWQPIRQPFPITPVELPPIAPPTVAAVAAGDMVQETLPAPAPPPPVVEKPAAPPVFPEAAKGPPERLSGSVVRWFVGNLPKLKIWVHFAAFAGLATFLALLTGSPRAGYLAGALGVISEFCEWAFGFGMDWGDAMDLVMDAVAVVAGILFWKWAMRWLSEKLRTRQP